MLLGWLVLALPAQAAICHNGCSGHGSCGLLGSCICDGNWAGRDCSFQLSLDSELPMTDSKEETLDTAALFDESPASVPASMPSMPKRSALAFAQSRRAAESAWATADKLFAAARSETSRDAIERVERAVSTARSRKDEIPGSKFAGMQAPPAASVHPCRGDCSNQGMCLAGKCLCNNGFYGESCEHIRCLNDCSGNGQCLTGRCKCSASYGGEDCSQLLQTQSSLAAFLRRGLAAESEELAKQQSPLKQQKAKACPLNCNSRGDCHDGTCKCHDGWAGLSCQDYEQTSEQPALVELAEAATSCAGQCSGNGICESGKCRCNEGFYGKACERGTAEPAIQPLQLKLQQVTKEDELRTVTCIGGCSGHGECKVGICDCETGWQGTACNISAEAAQGSEEETLAPAAASWIATNAAVQSGRALRSSQSRIHQDSKPSLLSTNVQGEVEPRIERESSLGTSAATALNSWLKTARTVSKRRPVDELASLLSSAVAPPQD